MYILMVTLLYGTHMYIIYICTHKHTHKTWNHEFVIKTLLWDYSSHGTNSSLVTTVQHIKGDIGNRDDFFQSNYILS